MVYQGSKSRLSKEIVPIIQSYIDDYNIKTYCEPFVGGANVIDKIKCEKRLGYDIHKNLIALFKEIQKDKDISFAPENCSFEHYKEVRANQNTGKYTDAYIGLIGFSASYGGRYFDGGYGRDKKGTRNIYAERLQNLREQAEDICNIEFCNKEYKKINKPNGVLFYCDPPYKGTKAYSNGGFNSEDFYEWCRDMSEGNIILVSEYEMPNDFKCIWKKEKKVMQKSDRIKAEKATEKLFIYQQELEREVENE